MAAARGIAERVERALARAAELEHLGAVWELDAERARERARALETAPPAARTPGPLAGTVCAWKDCFDVAGLHTTGGAPWRADAAPGRGERDHRAAPRGRRRDHDRQARDDAAGLGDDGPDARAGPPCRNPHDPERVPGGSSSGSAVAVATGIVDHAPGTDAGGSVRHPAAACGVVGFKPTYGAVPLDGCMPYAPSFDTGGAIARSVADAALQYAVIADVPPAELGGGLDGLRVAFLGGYFTAALEDDVAAMLERARGRVRAGEVDIAWSQDDNRAMSPIFTAEPGAFVLEHDPAPATRGALRPDHARRRRGVPHAAGDRLPARPRELARGAAALRGRGRRLRHPALRLGALPARRRSTARTRRRA